MQFAAVSVLGFALAVVAAQEQGYSGKWANVNVKEVIDNQRLFNRYKECFLSDTNAGCSQDIIELKKILPEALETTCGKCTQQQMEKLRELLTYGCETRKEDFSAILGQIDPSGKYRPQFEEKFGPFGC